MRDQAFSDLRRELALAGAETGEVDELVAVAAEVATLQSSARTEHRTHRRWLTSRPLGLATLASLVAAVVLVVLAQSTLPGSWLYPVQKLSDSAIIMVHPTYRGTIMVKRAQQVQQLVAHHADSQVVLAALADYQSEASTYRSSSTNYVMFEYCKASLQQAAAQAPMPERQAITTALASLQSI